MTFKEQHTYQSHTLLLIREQWLAVLYRCDVCAYLESSLMRMSVQLREQWLSFLSFLTFLHRCDVCAYLGSSLMKETVLLAWPTVLPMLSTMIETHFG